VIVAVESAEKALKGPLIRDILASQNKQTAYEGG